MALHEIDPRVFRGPLTWLVMMRQAPVYVRESPRERVWLIFILERETELIIGQEIALEPSPAVAVELLRQSFNRPMAGPNRRPALVVVESKALGDTIADELKLNVQVSDRPLAEGAAFLAEMKRFLDAGGGREPGSGEDDDLEEASYFDDDLPPALIRDLIKKGAALAKLRPWECCTDSDLIRLDIAEMGVKEAAVCVIGEMGQSRGVLVFRSHEDYLIQVGRGERLANQSEFSVEPIQLGVPLLSVNFDPAEEVSERMQKEAAAMGLKPGRSTFYPRILCVDPDGVRRPTAERDLRLILAVTTALTDAVRRVGRRLGDPDSWPLCFESDVPGCGTVRLVMPFQAGVLFDDDERGAASSEDAVARSRRSAEAEVLIEAMTLLLAAAETTFKDAGREIDRASKKHDADSLTPAWALFHRDPKNTGFTVAEALLRSKVGSRKARKWMEAQSRSWISAWHIADSSKGQFSCRDLITGEFRVFVDADPRTRGRLVQGDVFLGRIVDFESGPVVFGVGSYTLPLRAAGTVVESVRRALKSDQVTPEMLRGHRGGFVVRREWDKAASARRVK